MAVESLSSVRLGRVLDSDRPFTHANTNVTFSTFRKSPTLSTRSEETSTAINCRASKVLDSARVGGGGEKLVRWQVPVETNLRLNKMSSSAVVKPILTRSILKNSRLLDGNVAQKPSSRGAAGGPLVENRKETKAPHSSLFLRTYLQSDPVQLDKVPKRVVAMSPYECDRMLANMRSAMVGCERVAQRRGDLKFSKPD